jgi:hypothetical protein
MKLTAKILKQLIKEQLNTMNEMATPYTKNKGDIMFDGYKMRYYVYPVDIASRDNVEGFKGGMVGHYKVEKDSRLYKEIANQYPEAADNDVYVIGLENREMAEILISNGQIVKDRS